MHPDESGAEGAATQPESESLVRIFHRVNRLIPEEQSVVQALPDLPVADALKLMKEKGYSQLPVAAGGEVLGFFSYRSLALSLLRGDSLLSGLADLRVAEFLEGPAFVTIRTELSRLVEILDRDDAVVVGEESNLQAVVTPMDVLRYLMNVADAFVLLGEIELALRALIRQCVDDAALRQCIDHSLGHYADGERPERLEEFSFEDYISILRDGRNWPQFERVFGGTRSSLRAKLEPIREIRNSVFHFRRQELGVTVEEHEQLVLTRDWLLMRTRIYEAGRRERHAS